MKRKKLRDFLENRKRKFIKKSKYTPKSKQRNNNTLNLPQTIVMDPLNKNNYFNLFLKKNKSFNNPENTQSEIKEENNDFTLLALKDEGNYVNF